VVLNEGGAEMDTEVGRRTLRRITWRIVPFIMLLYFIAHIDRVNIGFAALTMNKDLGFTASMLGFGAGFLSGAISSLKYRPT
jgi:MFS transporter, ACS family, tartrate transporter